MTVEFTGRRLVAPLVIFAATICGCATAPSQSPKEAPAATIAAEPAPVGSAEAPARTAEAASSKPVQQRVRPGSSVAAATIERDKYPPA